MSLWDRIGDMLDYLQKPAGAYAGLMGGTYKALGGKQVDPEGQLGYDNPISGLISGWKKPEGMYRTMNKIYGDYQEPGTLESLIGGVSDIGYDPLILTGPMGGSSSILKDVPVLGKIAEGAGVAGKLGEDANILTKGGQYGRRYLTGLRLTGDPMAAIPVAMAQGGLERGITGLAKSKALTNVLSRGKSAVPVVEEVVGDVEKAVTKAAPEAEKVVPLTRTAAEPEITIVNNAKPRPVIKAPRAATATPASVPIDYDNPEKAGIAKLLALRGTPGGVPPELIEEADKALIDRRTGGARRPPPKITAPPRSSNPNIEAGLGTPALKNADFYESAIGPKLAESDMPGFLRSGKGPATPQEAAIQSIVEGQVDQDFDNWRRAAVGPFTPTQQSERAMLPEQLAYFLQNYGQ